MKSRYPIVASLLVCLVASVPTMSPATAEDTTTILTSLRWGGFMDRGEDVVTSTTKRRIVAAQGTRLTPTIFCSGPECEPDRPARIEIWRNGGWKTWTTGTLGQLADSSKTLTSKRPMAFIIRSVLPADGSLPEIASLRWTLRFLPATSVALTGTMLVEPSAATDHEWRFQRESGSVTLRVSPAAAGRTVELRDTMVVGYPLIGKATTDSSGTATITADFTDVRSLSITVLPTKERAGWTLIASPVE